MLPPFRILDRVRPVRIVQDPADVTQSWPRGAPSGWRSGLPSVAPYVAIEAELALGPRAGGTLRLELSTEGTRLAARLEVDSGRCALEVRAPDGPVRVLRSRRDGRVRAEPDRLALALTGERLSLLVRELGTGWRVRARYDLPRGLLDVRDPEVLAGLEVALLGEEPTLRHVRAVRAGGFGQLGLRDLHVATTPEGDPLRHEAGVLMTATGAGPGFFPTAHTGVWAFDPQTHRLRHLSDLFFRRTPTPPATGRGVRRGVRRGSSAVSRPGLGVYGDHGTHLVRLEDRWLVLTSSWGDFEHRGVRVLQASSTDDLTRGRHVLDAEPLALPSPEPGTWDPHLVRDGEDWVLAYVAAPRFFDFHPVLARGPRLEDLRLLAADPHRHATEGVVIIRPTGPGGPWRLVASDGRGGRHPAGYPVFDENLIEVDRLAAPYPTNLPWPNVWREGEDWLMVTFNGARAGGRVAGYGTHGQVVIMSTAPPEGAGEGADEAAPEGVADGV